MNGFWTQHIGSIHNGWDKKLAQKAIESKTGDLLGEAQKSILAKNEKAEKLAEETLKKNKLNKKIAKELSSTLRPLDPKQVAAGKVVREDLGAIGW